MRRKSSQTAACSQPDGLVRTLKTKHLILANLLTLSAGYSAHASLIVLDVGTMTIAPNGKLNIRNNAAIVRLSPFEQIYGYVVTGCNAGTWDGYGIWSSVAAADLAQIAAVGCISNAEAGYSSFFGHTTPTGAETFVLGTYYGDANLDGSVDALDYALITPGGTDWYHGDFNYDGIVNAADTALIDHTVAILGGPEPSIPEPATSGLLGFGTLLLAAGRRRSA